MTKIAIALVAVLVAAHLAIWTVTLLVSPLGYDEAFILQAPLNLVQGFGYSTEDWLGGGANLPFDATLSTGPVLGIPAALSLSIFGVSITAARIVTLPFLLLLIWGLIVLGRRYAGWWGAAAALGVLLVLDTRADLPFSVIYGPSDVLGEYATASLLVLAIVILPRHPYLAGLVVGFAMLSKFLAAIAIPAFVFAILVVPMARGLGRRFGDAAAFVGFVAVPNVLWELVKLVSLGPSGYLESLWSYLRFVFRSGSGADGSNSGAYLDRASRLFATWQFPTIVAILLGLAMLALCIVGIWRRAIDRGFVPQRGDRWVGRAGAFLAGAGGDVVAAAVSLGGVVLWWTLISSSTYIRHTLPILIWTVPILAALAVRGLQWLFSRGRAWRTTAAVASVIAAGATIYGGALTLATSTQSAHWTRADQEATADFVRSLGVESVQGVGWWAAPDIRFLSGVISRPLGTGSTGPLVIEPMMEIHNPSVYATVLDMCVDTLFERNGFIVCDIESS